MIPAALRRRELPLCPQRFRFVTLWGDARSLSWGVVSELVFLDAMEGLKMSPKESRPRRRRSAGARGAWALLGLLALAGRASAGAWSIENPVAVMDFDGSFIGTSVPVSYQEVEDTLAWFAPDPIEVADLCISEFVYCSIQANDILFFAFEVGPGQGLITGDGLGANLSNSISDGGWLVEIPDDPSTVNPTGASLSGFGQVLTFDGGSPGAGDRTAILLGSFGLGEIDEQLAKPNHQAAIRLRRFVGGSDTPVVPVRVPEPSAQALAMVALGVLALLRLLNRGHCVGLSDRGCR